MDFQCFPGHQSIDFRLQMILNAVDRYNVAFNFREITSESVWEMITGVTIIHTFLHSKSADEAIFVEFHVRNAV